MQPLHTPVEAPVFPGLGDPIRRTRWVSVPLTDPDTDALNGGSRPAPTPGTHGTRLVLVGTQHGQVRTSVYPSGCLFTSWVGSVARALSDGVRDVAAIQGASTESLLVSVSANGTLIRTTLGLPLHTLTSSDWTQSRLCRPMPLQGHALLLVTTDLGRMHLLQAERGTALRSFVDPPHIRRALAADWLYNQAIVLGYDDGSIALKDPSSLRVLHEEPRHPAGNAARFPVVDLVALSEHGLVAAVYGVVPLIRLYDIRKGLGNGGRVGKISPAIVQELAVPSSDSVIALKWLPGKQRLWTLGVGGHCERFSVDGAASVLCYEAGLCLPVGNGLYSCFDITAEGGTLVTGDLGGCVQYLHLEESEKLEALANAQCPDPALSEPALIEALCSRAARNARPRRDLTDSTHTEQRCWLADTPWPLVQQQRGNATKRLKFRFPLLASPIAIRSARFVGPVGYLPVTGSASDQLYLQPDEGWQQTSISTASMQPKLDTLEERVRFRRIDLVKAESLDGFDYALYNRTRFCGLENSLPTMYMNPILQMFFFIRPFREAMFGLCHRFACTGEELPTSIAAELGYLYDMMERGGSLACDTVRLMYAFQQSHQAVALGLVDRLSGGPTLMQSGIPLERLVDKFCRFLLENLSREEMHDAYGAPPDQRVIERLFAFRTRTCIRSVASGLETTREDVQYVLSLSSDDAEPVEAAHFPSLVNAALRQTQPPIRALHPASQKVELVEQRREVLSLAPYLLCSSAGITVRSLQPELELELPLDAACYRYRLIGEVVGVRPANVPASTNQQKAPAATSTVAFLRIQGLEPHQASLSAQEGSWYCFNDFTITAVRDAAQVERFDSCFMQPLLLLYRRETGVAAVALDDKPPVSFEARLWPDSETEWARVFALRPMSTTHKRLLQAGDRNALRARLSFVPLQPGERLTRGALVAIDTEFVLVSREKAEICCSRRSTGHTPRWCRWSSPSLGQAPEEEEPLLRRVILEPSRKHVARVTVIRENGQVLLDDYVMPPPGCTIVDYLTRYSGITAPDLQPNRTRHYLTLSKYVYAKLHALQRTGCVFVGHGLRSDFRQLNFLLRSEQYRDTALLFRLPANERTRGRSRLLSLRFLAGCLLKRRVQNGSQGHDSVEDARAALDLYRLYLELEQRQLLKTTVERLYEYGSRKHWQPDFADPFELAL
jgi:DNA polymerase III epsilon subunit-like protein